jgi:type I restriction enzyme M protein
LPRRASLAELGPPYGDIRTNPLFFTRGGPTGKVWDFDLSGLKVGKTGPLTLAHFEGFFRLLPTRADVR